MTPSAGVYDLFRLPFVMPQVGGAPAEDAMVDPEGLKGLEFSFFLLRNIREIQTTTLFPIFGSEDWTWRTWSQCSTWATWTWEFQAWDPFSRWILRNGWKSAKIPPVRNDHFGARFSFFPSCGWSWPLQGGYKKGGLPGMAAKMKGKATWQLLLLRERIVAKSHMHNYMRTYVHTCNIHEYLIW